MKNTSLCVGKFQVLLTVGKGPLWQDGGRIGVSPVVVDAEDYDSQEIKSKAL